MIQGSDEVHGIGSLSATIRKSPKGTLGGGNSSSIVIARVIILKKDSIIVITQTSI